MIFVYIITQINDFVDSRSQNFELINNFINLFKNILFFIEAALH